MGALDKAIGKVSSGLDFGAAVSVAAAAAVKKRKTVSKDNHCYGCR